MSRTLRLPAPLALPPSAAGESLLEEAIALAGANGLVRPHDHVVAVSLSSSREAMVKVGTHLSLGPCVAAVKLWQL